MNTTIRSALCLCGALLLGACAAPPLQHGPGDEFSAEGLHRMSGTAFAEVWARPGLRTSNYSEIVLETTSVAYREVGEGIRYESPRRYVRQDAFPIPQHLRERIEQTFEKRLSQALDGSSQFRHVSEAAPGTLSLRAVLVDFVSKVPPERTYGPSRVYVTSVGEATLIVELWDNERDELLVRAVDHGKAGPPGSQLIRGNEVTSWVEIDHQMERWATEVRQLVDQLHRLDRT
jgi:hypothetical protein